MAFKCSLTLGLLDFKIILYYIFKYHKSSIKHPGGYLISGLITERLGGEVMSEQTINLN